jgi:hypothetical protein
VYQQKQRHGFLAVYLGSLLAFAVIGTAYDVVVALAYTRDIPFHDRWTYLVSVLSGALGVVFLVALLRWKKWGFYGFVLLCTADLGFRWTSFGYPMRDAVSTFVALVVLCVALQVGGERQGWKQLD